MGIRNSVDVIRVQAEKNSLISSGVHIGGYFEARAEDNVVLVECGIAVKIIRLVASRSNVRIVTGVPRILLVSDTQCGSEKVKIRVLQNNTDIVGNRKVAWDGLGQHTH